MLQTRSRSAGLSTAAVACMAAIAYVDPGNFAVNVAAGAQHGYSLIWVVVAASLIASVVQYLAAKLGAATGMSLAENCRTRYRRGYGLLWVQAELVVVMTDLAELVGGAFALHLLFGLPMVVGALFVAAFGFVVLAVRVRGYDGFRPVLLAFFALIVGSLLYQAFVAGVDARALLRGTVPGPLSGSAATLAVGIIGATVMPHALHFHSAVSRNADGRPNPRSLEAADGVRHRTRRAVVVAMTLAGLANIAIVLIATRLPAVAGDSLPVAYAELGRVAGRVSTVLFGVALLASGLASTIVGIYTGQVVMQGFWRRPMAAWLRRALATVPPLVLLALGLDATRALVLSQVVLSFALPASLVPLVALTRSRTLMGPLVNHPVTTAVAGTAAVLIMGLDAYLLITTFA